MCFFDNTPFGESKQGKNRYNERYKRIIQQKISHVRGKKVLDLGSHNGVWSWAALESGASYVFGIEGRQKLIDQGAEAFAKFRAETYAFTCGDVFDVLSRFDEFNQPYFDTIFCLGLFYHIMDHCRLMRLMASLKPRAIILDTGVIESEELVVKCFHEGTDHILNAISENSGAGKRLVGFPSVGLVEAMSEECGYVTRRIEWRSNEVASTENLVDYFVAAKNGKKRATFLLTPMEPDQAAPFDS